MDCCDVNVVVAAIRPDHRHHAAALTAIETRRSLHRDIAVPDFVASSALRLLTSSRVFADPETPSDAIAAVERMLTPPGRLLTGTTTVWRTFTSLVGDLSLRGNDIPDALLAAACLANRAELLTFDRGFAKYPGLRWSIPDTA